MKLKQKIVSLMLLIALVVGGFSFGFSVEASTRVKGYYKPSTGTYVQPYYRSSPNRNKYDNYSSKGNYNLYSGKKGYKNW